MIRPSLEWLLPWMLLLIPVPLLIRLLWRPREQMTAALTVPRVTSFRAEEGTFIDGDRTHFPWRVLLLWIVWILLVLAAARPQWTGDVVTLPTTGRDLMLAVDISGSMGTEDLELAGQMVNRLTVVKSVVSEFVEARKGDRVGLILFGTNAYLQAPLTFDLASVNRLLVEAPVGIAGGKTAIGDAIGLGVKRLRSRPLGERVLILLTDGASNVGEIPPVKAAELASVEDIKIYTIGVGANEMRMPGPFGLFGSRVVNPSADLDEDTLTKIAELTSGRYFRAQNTAELQEIYQLIDAMEPIEQDAQTYRPTAVLYHWPLGMAWAFFCMLVACLWRGWGDA